MTYPPHITTTVADGKARITIEQIERWVKSSSETALRYDTFPEDQPQPAKPRRRKRSARVRPADGLRTKEEAAAKLGCSIKTLNGHVASGALRYVPMGHGKKRLRRMYADADLDEFIANQTRKDVPCPSAATRARRSGSTDSKSEIVSFSEVQRRRRSAKPKR